MCVHLFKRKSYISAKSVLILKILLPSNILAAVRIGKEMSQQSVVNSLK